LEPIDLTPLCISKTASQTGKNKGGNCSSYANMDAKAGAIDEQRHQNYTTNTGSPYQGSRE